MSTCHSHTWSNGVLKAIPLHLRHSEGAFVGQRTVRVALTRASGDSTFKSVCRNARLNAPDANAAGKVSDFVHVFDHPWPSLAGGVLPAALQSSSRLSSVSRLTTALSSCDGGQRKAICSERAQASVPCRRWSPQAAKEHSATVRCVQCVDAQHAGSAMRLIKQRYLRCLQCGCGVKCESVTP